MTGRPCAGSWACPRARGWCFSARRAFTTGARACVISSARWNCWRHPRTPPIVLALFGEFGGQAPRLPFPVLPAGYVTQDAQLALLYAMADAYVLPSLEENLPNVILESLACGTPVVAFDTGGIPDMIEHRKTGWLVPPGDAAGLADGLRWALAAQGPEAALRTRLCRSVALERYPLAVQARAYANLYREILARRAGQGT